MSNDKAKLNNTDYLYFCFACYVNTMQAMANDKSEIIKRLKSVKPLQGDSM